MDILVFGTGSFYLSLKDQLNIAGINIIAFIDNNPAKQNTFFEKKKIILPIEVMAYEYDFIVIASTYWPEIEQQLICLGIDKKKIIIPGLRRKESKSTHNDFHITHQILNMKQSENTKKMSVIVEDGNAKFIKRFINLWNDAYDIYIFHLDTITCRLYMKEILLNSDICFFEWCGDLLAYASHLAEAEKKPLACRLHRYEVFDYDLKKINFHNVDRMILIAEHIQSIFLEKTNLDINKTAIIYNGFDLEAFNYKDRSPGFNIAYLGAIIYRKAPELLLQIIKKLVKKDCRYKLFLGGDFGSEELKIYFNYMIREMGLEDHVFLDGFQTNVNVWLEDKNFIICSSIGEGHITAIQEAMLKGIKPIIHNYPGAKELYSEKHLWNTIDDAVNLIANTAYQSSEYRDMVLNDFSLYNKAEEFEQLFDDLLVLYKN